MNPQTEQAEWYRQKRREIAAVFNQAEPGETEIHTSPSKKYRLEVTNYSTGPKSWSYSRCLVFAGADLLAKVDRNYGAFPFSWCENHFNGHSYLICGEDYQGQTVIELDTGARADHIEPQAEQGFGFCWAAHYPSPDGRYLVVDGCYWACPYDLVLFDFSSPLELPYRELRRWDCPDKVEGFQPDGTFVATLSREVLVSDGRPISELSDEEEEELQNTSNDSEWAKDQTYRLIWSPDGTESQQVVDNPETVD